MTGPYFVVPKGTPASRCRSCDARIYWIVTDAGRRMPVDCGADARCVLPTAAAPGLGFSHFATCPDAGRWRTPCGQEEAR